MILNLKKYWNLLNFVTFKEPWEKLDFLKIAAKAFEAGNFLNISHTFRVLEAHFFIKCSLIKKHVYFILCTISYFMVLGYFMDTF